MGLDLYWWNVYAETCLLMTFRGAGHQATTAPADAVTKWQALFRLSRFNAA